MENSAKNQEEGRKGEVLLIFKKRRLIILVLVVVSVAILFLLDWQKEKEVFSSRKDEEREEIPLLDVRGASLVRWNEDGEKIWKVEADWGVQFSDRMVLKEVEFYLFAKGEFVSKGETKEVIIDRDSNLILKGDIVLVSYLNGTQLFTSEMKWITSESRLETEAKVIIKRKNIIVEGLGLIASPDLSQVEIKSRAVTKFVGNS